ncbi:hypothetical protein M5K25_012872 [Dendrobium thyrsiflorum]|uniref:Uncharacterized protein n=1 Tax=Dendrobium thyrsiflorum TaxID=117978 RepID=A0ABD0UYU3_DENTH
MATSLFFYCSFPDLTPKPNLSMTSGSRHEKRIILIAAGESSPFFFDTRRSAKKPRTGEEIGDKAKKLDDSTNPHIITKMLKTIHFHASVIDNVQHVSILFKALRSDGQEVLVDDKDLKLNNPLLLRSYYEQHHRNSSLSRVAKLK